MTLLARIVRWMAGAVVLLLIAGIVLHLVHANAGNGVVSTIYDADNWLASPFANVFSIKDTDVQIAVHRGLAALVYAIVGWLITALPLRAAVGRGPTVPRPGGGVTTT